MTPTDPAPRTREPIGREPLISDTAIYGLLESVSHDDEFVTIWDAHRLMMAMRDDYEAALTEARSAVAKPSDRKNYTGVRGGLLKGRIRMKGVREPNLSRPSFDTALKMATTDDLMYALDLLIKHPNARRTWRDVRIKHIDKRLREIMAAQGEAQP